MRGWPGATQWSFAAAACRRLLFPQVLRACTHKSGCSIYDYEHYPFLWEPITCMLSNVSYSHRVNVLGVCGGSGPGAGWRQRSG